jgi:hypothetical protein
MVDPEPVTVVGLNEVVAPVAPAMLKLTVPLNPFMEVMVMLYWAVWPNFTVALVGDDAVIVKSGAAAGFTIRLRLAVPVPQLFVALMVTLNDPETEGVPETRPIEVLTERPEGRPVAL